MATASDAVDFDLETVNNVEEAAYQDGYQQGFDHGALHGTFEGRELGREKGFELWEEVAFYQGLAKVWKECLEQAEAAGHTSRKQSKQLQHLAGLEKLISFFPATNTSDPSTDLRPTEPVEEVGEESEDAEAETTNDDELAKLDMLALLEKIRAKYRLTCSVLGIAPQRAPSLAQIGRSRQEDDSDNAARAESKSVLVAGKLVDPTQLKY